MTDFEDIRPYNDNEVQKYLLEIIDDKAFLAVVDYLVLSKKPKIIASILRLLVRPYLRYKARRVKSIYDLQNSYSKRVLEDLIHRTNTEIKSYGDTNISASDNYLFMSNHIDIVMDSAFINYYIHCRGLTALKIAIGDNLLSMKFVEHLARLNQAFKVIREVGSGRKALQTFLQLSAYISHIIGSGENIWIAQREGRSKDNVFDTDSAIIKMFCLSRRNENFGDVVNSLKILPVSISYEWDPCDIVKAREIVMTRRDGFYKKGEFEDVDSIVKGMVGTRGMVALTMGEQVKVGSDATPESVAGLITRAIKMNYKIMPTNIVAYQKFSPGSIDPEIYGYTSKEIADTALILEERIKGEEAEVQYEILKNYANPLIEQQK